jgi:hypothetical protein
MDFEKLGLFYLGRRVDPDTQEETTVPLLYDASDLVTHAVILGMTGSGKTGLGIGLIEEAAIDGIPVLAIDPKGDLANLLLTFPNLTAAAFGPWVNPDAARLQGVTAEVFAAAEATRWREGLASWGQDSDRIARLRDAAEFSVYTPGSRAARPLSVLGTFQPPAVAVLGDPEQLAERASAAATSLLTFAGVEREPLRSREHILLSTLLTEAWRQQRSLDLAGIIAEVQSPPVTHVGVLALDAFYPPADRFKLAMDLNRLLAAPDFAVWLEGDPLDMNDLLYTNIGKPRVTVLSIAHLDDRERMFLVSLVLNELVSWMRGQRGTSTLRALVYIDEMTGFLPPVAMPPSKPALLTLLKQARAFGVGMTLATQNPVDLDYKALANAGTWFIGRLQTERDKDRLLDGLDGAQAAAGHGVDRATTDRLLSSLQKRTFLLHNVHDSVPLLFKTRWTLSYLRGPLGRGELGRLAGDRGDTGAAGAAGDVGGIPAAGPVTPAPVTPMAPGPAAPLPPMSPVPPRSFAAPVLDPAIQQFFAPGAGSRSSPYLLGAARVSYANARLNLDESRDIVMLTPITEGPIAVDWQLAEPANFTIADLSREPADGRPFEPLPPAGSDAKKYAQWARDFTYWVSQSQVVELLQSARTKMISRPDEPERDFRLRLDTTLREYRDAEMKKIRERYGARLATLEDRVRRAEVAVEREQQQASESKVQAGVSMAATIFGALLGRRAVSATTLGRATTAARGVGRVSREAKDVERAAAELRNLRAKHAELTRTLDGELEAIAARWDARHEQLERVLVKPRRGGTSVQLVGLVWMPRL